MLQIYTKPNNIASIVNKGIDFEIETNTKLNTLEKSQHAKVSKPKASEQNNVNLPKMEIRKFSGDSQKWLTFIDSFNSAIHASSRLSDVEKFNYLQRYLEGDALTSISGLALTLQNYT